MLLQESAAQLAEKDTYNTRPTHASKVLLIARPSLANSSVQPAPMELSQTALLPSLLAITAQSHTARPAPPPLDHAMSAWMDTTKLQLLTALHAELALNLASQLQQSPASMATSTRTEPALHALMLTLPPAHGQSTITCTSPILKPTL